MAACPFRAFAKHRLGARPLEAGGSGREQERSRQRGSRTLALIWSELGSLAKLRELAPEQIRELISRSVASAIAAAWAAESAGTWNNGVWRNCCRSGWRSRKRATEFTVQRHRAGSVVSLGGLQIRTRADRIDRLPNGREIILDYKTGSVLKSSGWEGDRPDEPQLPLYCATSDEPIAGAAFALIRIGELGFRGCTERWRYAARAEEHAAGNVRDHSASRSWNGGACWRSWLSDIGAGDAAVDPKPARAICADCALCAAFGSSKMIADKPARERALDTSDVVHRAGSGGVGKNRAADPALFEAARDGGFAGRRGGDHVHAQGRGRDALARDRGLAKSRSWTLRRRPSTSA